MRSVKLDIPYEVVSTRLTGAVEVEKQVITPFGRIQILLKNPHRDRHESFAKPTIKVEAELPPTGSEQYLFRGFYESMFLFSYEIALQVLSILPSMEYHMELSLSGPRRSFRLKRKAGSQAWVMHKTH